MELAAAHPAWTQPTGREPCRSQQHAPPAAACRLHERRAATAGGRPPRLARPSLPRTKRAARAVTAAAAQERSHASSPPACETGRNILVAADSSEDSRQALRWTVQELYRPGDTIHVAHCIPYLPVPPGGVYAIPDGRIAMVNVDALVANDEQFLLAEQAAMERMCGEAFEGVQVAHVVDILREDPLGSGDKGRIAEALCHKAEELQASVVVIASQAKSGLSEFLLGSVASHCATHSAQPVLVLHAPTKLQQAGAGGGRHADSGLLGRLASAAASALGGRGSAEGRAAAAGASETGEAQAGGATAATATAVKGGREGRQKGGGDACSLSRHIVLAVDDSEASEKACRWALANLVRRGDKCHLLRIIPTLPYRATYGGPVLDGMVFYTDPPTEAFKEAAEHFVQNRFEPLLQEAGVPYEADIIVEPVDESVGGVGDAICQRAEELDAAVVVLGSHMRGGLLQFMLGSVATYVSHHCRRPVAVLH